MSKKTSRHDEHEDSGDHEEHIDERWLVSYADMMTLLFGLFVMLFSIASEKQGNFKEELQSISKSSFAQNEVVKPTPAPKPPEPDNQKELNEKLTQDLQNLQNELKIEKLAHDDLVEKQKEFSTKENDFTEKESLQAKQIENLKKQIRIAARAPAKLEEDKDNESVELKQKLKQVETDNSQKEKKWQTEIAALKQKISDQKAEAKREIASEEKPKVVDHEKELAEVKTDLQNEKQELETLKAETAQQKAELEAKTKDLQTKNDELKKKLDGLENQKKSGQFMMVVLKWTSEKHDLDLTVTDPEGKVFNFKNRKFPGHPGEFTLDSRTGPGAEIWQTDKIIPGEYIVSWRLYNTYGNDKPVNYSGIITSNSDKVVIPDSTLPAKVGAEKSMKITVDQAGKFVRP